MRLGVIGAGYWGGKLIGTFNRDGGASVQVVCDVDPERRRAIAGVETVATATAVLTRDDVDAVVVATPPATHAALAREVLLAGKHCWVEKPLAMRAAEARALVQLARAQGRMLFVDETFLYDPLVQRAKAWIDSGRLGCLHHLAFERLSMGRIRRDSDVWWNAAPHDISILCYLTPARVETIRVDGFAYVQPGTADIAVATLALSGGLSAHIHVSWLSPSKTASVTAIGSRGMLRYTGRFGERSLQCFEYAIADPAAVTGNLVPVARFAATECVLGGDEEPLSLAAAAFLDAVHGGVPPPSAGEYSQRVVEILEAGRPATVTAA